VRRECDEQVRLSRQQCGGIVGVNGDGTIGIRCVVHYFLYLFLFANGHMHRASDGCGPTCGGSCGRDDRCEIGTESWF
jgi:hypothetical protein